MEIWNNVFMEYIKDENGNFNMASMQNVDTGM
jgi:alanyl-tRNA synthetase